MATIIFDQSAEPLGEELVAVVSEAGGLNVSIRPFKYSAGGNSVSYPGIGSFALVDNAMNYVYGVIDSSIESSVEGYPTDVSHKKLARVQTGGGVVTAIIMDSILRRSGAWFTDDGAIEFPITNSVPAAPPVGKLSVYARNRATRPFLDVQSPSGREYPLQPFFGNNRIVMHSPESSTTVRTWGMPITNVGTVSHPALDSTSLLGSMRRWRVTSATTANSAAESRSAQSLVFRGNAAGRGGFTLVIRASFTAVPANNRGFFGLLASTSAISTTQSPPSLTNCAGFGWDSGEGTLKFMINDGSGVCTETELGSGFPTDSVTAAYTMFVHSAPNGSEIGWRIVREDTGETSEGVESLNIPANTTFLTYHAYMNNGGTASACAFDCAGVYIESDY